MILVGNIDELMCTPPRVILSFKVTWPANAVLSTRTLLFPSMQSCAIITPGIIKLLLPIFVELIPAFVPLWTLENSLNVLF